MKTIDDPINLTFHNGNNFPPNFKMIAYVLIVAGLGLIISGAYIFGGLTLLLSLAGITNQHIIHIDADNDILHEYNSFFGFIKLGKKYPLHKFKYVTAMPLIEGAQVYASTSNSTSISNSYHTITIFGDRLRGKRVIRKYDSKAEAKERAMKLADRLQLKYFDYDPKIVRKVLTGQITL